MEKKYIDMIESLCDDVRKYPDNADKFLNLIVSICKFHKIDRREKR